MRNLKLSSKVRIRKDLDGYVLYRSNGLTLLLNPTAYETLSACNGKNSPTDIAGLLSNKYNVDREIAEKNVIEFLEHFKKMGMLE